MMLFRLPLKKNDKTYKMYEITGVIFYNGKDIASRMFFKKQMKLQMKLLNYLKMLRKEVM